MGSACWHLPARSSGTNPGSTSPPARTPAEANIQPSPPYAGKLGRVALLDFGIGAVASDPNAGTISLAGAPLGLAASTAAAFNQAFAEGKAVFAAGEAVGSLSFSAQGQ